MQKSMEYGPPRTAGVELQNQKKKCSSYEQKNPHQSGYPHKVHYPCAGVGANGDKWDVMTQIREEAYFLAEQHRIVAKVDQLMALVDELEAQLAASRAAGEKLLAALVAELTARKESPAPAQIRS